jgi:hypothetical protein
MGHKHPDKHHLSVYFLNMSTVAEILEAVKQLPEGRKGSFSTGCARLISRMRGIARLRPTQRPGGWIRFGSKR